MTAPFPGLKPTQRSFTPGAFPVKTYRALSGVTVKRAFGNRAYGHQLQVQFENVADSVATQIVNHYNITKGGFDRFTLPAELFAGMSATLTSTIQAPTQIQWEYSGPPGVQSVFPGFSSISLAFTGELTYP